MDPEQESIEEFSGIEQPPLLEQIKRILDEYRNDVQIIKELIQNADDAEATSMSILYEGRTINPERENESEYCKFLRAPALVFYNNKTFTNDDWRGIRSIYTSIKRDDPLKIGRFGLGFKSVFHLTDYPCIISGENALFINPHAQEFGRICVTVKLKNLKEWHRLNKNDYINSLFNTFSFNEDTLTSGYYNGTMFWFPLRQQPSPLSENTYTEDNVYSLLHAFITEADRSLLFLKTLCGIKLFVDIPVKSAEESQPSKTSYQRLNCMNLGKESFCFTVDVSSKSGDIQTAKKEFLNELQEIGNEVPENSQHWTFNITVQTLTKSTQEETKVAKARWLIVNYLKGGEISEKLGLLMKDKDLGYPHIVSIAASIDKQSNFTSGHVFCYQPLPQENVCMTGLPVHINGFFALSQNRRHVRWPDQGDITYGQGDKKIEWNMELISQILPEAYERLLIELVNLCQKKGNPEHLLKAVYKAVPDLSVVVEHWQSLANMVPIRCKDRLIFFTEQDGGKWIQAHDAVFLNSKTCRSPAGQTDEYMSTVFDLLISDKVNAIIVPDHVSDAFDKTGETLNYATPKYLKLHLALPKHDTYKSLDLDKKQDLFEFVMMDSSTEGLDLLELLPLADGTFKTFSGNQVMLESQNIIDLFPGQESRFVFAGLRENTKKCFVDLITEGDYGLSRMSDDGAVTMVTRNLKEKFGNVDTIHVKHSECREWVEWIKNIWCLIQSRFGNSIQKFIDCSIFPTVNIDDVKTMSELILIKLSTKILYLPSFSQLDDKSIIKQAFDLLSVSIIEQIPADIDNGLIDPFIHYETSKGITSILERITSDQVNNFNSENSIECSAVLLKFLAERIHTNLRKTCKQTLREIKLFKGFRSKTHFDLVSLKETDNIFDGKHFPIDFPAKMILLESSEEKGLVEHLDGNVISEIELVRMAMRNINQYDSYEKQNFAFWIITNGEHFKYHDVQDGLKNIDFLESLNGLFFRPNELFDPSEDILQDLFNGESMFPKMSATNEQNLLLLIGLKQIGLKSEQNLTAANIYHVCDVVHKMMEENVKIDVPKCRALLNVMNKYSHLLQEDVLNNKNCIIIEDTLEDSYSKDIPLKNRQDNAQDAKVLICKPSEIHSAKHVNLIGSVMFIIDCKNLASLSDVFNWGSQPSVSNVLEHLHNMIRHYEPRLKASYLPIVTFIYDWLSKQNEIENEELIKMINIQFSKPQNSFVWDGSQFQPIESMYIESKKGDVDLKPFLYPLPSELQNYADFFLTLGCQQSIGFNTYVETLDQIRISEQGTIENKDLEETFTAMAIAILNRIKRNFFNDSINSEKELYFPTVKENGGIQMMPALLCTFCDEEWLKNMNFQLDGDIKYIHPDLPIPTAEALGVPSLRKQMMSDTEAFAEWGQEEPLTRRLRNLLNEGYVDGFSVAKEVFQNADDAGAKTLCILYDERENNDAKTGLISDKMAECQGPAIWIYNDALFTESDFKNITKLSGATKEDDSTKIGKFGLGFCAVYNLTDVPSFISGESIVFFDPAMSHLENVLPGRSPGLRVNFRKLSNLKMLKSLQNQFKPFEGVFDCRILDTSMPSFNGTLFRLPLRNKASDISDIVYTASEVKGLFEKIMSMAANMLLFNQNVVDFKLLHIPKTGYDLKNPKLLFEVQKNAVRLCASDDDGFRASSMLVEASNRKQKKSLLKTPLQVIDKISVNIKAYADSKFASRLKQSKKTDDWFISWSTGTDEKSVNMCYEEKGTLPLGAVAIPVKHTNEGIFKVSPLESVGEHFYQSGHFFFFLPLPIQHKFPFHINGQFIVTSDRRQLRTSTEDDKNVKMTKWNRYLLEDSVTQALLYLLVQMHKHVSTDEYKFTQFWPMHETAEVLEYLPVAFYQNIVKPGVYNVFEKNGQWFDISKCIFIERNFRKADIGDIVFEILSMIKEFVIDVPDNIYDFLKQADELLINQSTVSMETFFLDYLFPNFEKLSSDHMNGKMKQLICFAVNLENEKMDDWLKQNKCIPSQPRGILKRPCELIDTNSILAKMFATTDCYFPESPFNDEQLSRKLRNLGLKFNVLTDDIIIKRAASIETLCKKCFICASERSKCILEYLKNKIQNHENICMELGNTKFVPVRGKPKDWAFEWHADMFLCNKNEKKCKLHKTEKRMCTTSFFDRPSNMYFINCKNIVGCVAFVFDGSCCHVSYSDEKLEKMLAEIGMKGINKGSIPVDFVLQNLISVTAAHKDLPLDKTNVKVILHDIYQHLEKVCQTKDQSDIVAKSIQDRPVVYVGKQFVFPSHISKSRYSDCKPYLFRLNDSCLKKFPFVSKCLSIKDYFDPCFIALTIQKIKQDNREKSLSMEEIRTTINILYCLRESIVHFHGKSFDVQSICKGELEAIFGPDEHGVLQDCRKMCFNDYDGIEKSKSMIYAHESFPLDLAKFVGVNSKLIYSLEESSEAFEDDFFQNEPLITRLSNLIEGYPCDSGILKELIQNADDAKATEIHFLKDYTSHPTNSVIDPMFEPLQGPALVVYNDSAFSNDDLKGIQMLGRGNKSDDPSKTGRYGVGFNAVYNLTDAPSFFTRGGDIDNGETLCIFDPMAKYVPNVTKQKPGKRYKDVRVIRKRHCDMMSGYHEKYFITGKHGTVFRFPLRTKEMAETSEIKKESVTMDMISEILERFSRELNCVLLFLKHLKTIRISSMKDNCLEQEFEIEIEMSKKESENRQKYVQKQKQMCEEFKTSKENIFTFDQFSTIYEQTMNVRRGKISNAFHYVVVQVIGFNNKEDIEPVIRKKIKSGNLGLLPHGGVALQTKQRTQLSKDYVCNHICKAFCFLPLPINTGLPVHVHGYFALDYETRRSLWKSENEETCYRTLWNKMLMENVVSKAYVYLLQYMKTQLFQNINDERTSFPKVKSALEDFQYVLPVNDKISDYYWKHLMVSVYKRLASDHIEFLPVLHTTFDETESLRLKIEIKWTSLNISGSRYPAYVQNQDLNEINKTRLNSILRRIGMRIVYVSSDLKESMDFAGVGIEYIKPMHVIDFICKSDNADTDCTIETGRHIMHTSLKTVADAADVLFYCLKDAEKFASNIEYIPLFVTGDNIVRTLPKRGYFLLEAREEFCEFFPSRRCDFLHITIARQLKDTFINKKAIFLCKLKRFKLLEFIALVSETGLLKDNCTNFIQWKKVKPSQEWVRTFWKYFVFQLEEKSSEIVSQQLQVIWHFPIIPVLKSSTEEVLLAPPCSLERMLDIESFATNRDLYTTFQKLSMPHIYQNFFTEKESSELRSAYELLLKQVPNFTKPLEVLECLHINLHNHKIENFTNMDVLSVLRYFNDFVDEGTPSNHLKTLQKLPIFLSHFGEHVCLKDYDKKFVVQNDLPTKGLHDLAYKAGVLLLRNTGHKKLFKHLNIDILSSVQVYVRLIIPNYTVIQSECFYDHLEYISTFRFTSTYTPDPDLFELLSLLKEIELVKMQNGRFAKVCDLFDPIHPVFRQMCKKTELVPVIFSQTSRQANILSLFRKIGLKTTMTLSLFERFATEIATQGDDEEITDTIYHLSKTLTTHLLSMDIDFFRKNCFEKLARIKFVTPYVVERELSTIKQQFNSSKMICFEGSLLTCKKHIAWTVLNILPLYISPKTDIVLEKLKICQKPSLAYIVLHCKNIAENINGVMTKLESFGHSILSKIMDDLYHALENFPNDNMNRMQFNALSHIPTIYFPELDIVVPAKRVVISCKKDEEIHPYLLKVPTCFVKYTDLFIRLGASQEPTCELFAFVISTLKEQVSKEGSSELLPQEYSVAIKAMCHFLKYLANETEMVDISRKDLFLLSEKKTIENSNMLVVSDNVYFRSALDRTSSETCMFLIEFAKVFEKNKRSENWIEHLQKLPKIHRPHLLTEIVVERVILDDIVRKDGKESIFLKEFMHSKDFLFGFLRLYRHTLELKNGKWSKSIETFYADSLKKVSFVQCSGIKTQLYIKQIESGKFGREVLIENTKKKRYIHTELSEDNVRIYFDTSDIKWIQNVRKEMTVHLNRLTREEKFDTETSIILAEIVGMYKVPHEIEFYLSQERIKEYTFDIDIVEENSSYPIPGEIVPERFHRYLDNDYGLIYEFDFKFIALEVDDPCFDAEFEEEQSDNETASTETCMPTYKYVYIIRKLETENELPLLQEYEIDCGAGKVQIVKGFQLYKFVRSKKGATESGTAIDVYSGNSSESAKEAPKAASSTHPSFKDACKEVRKILIEAWKKEEHDKRRIIKRLMLKWHPDKNPDNIDFCTKLFQYLQQCLFRLENGLDLKEEEDDTDTGSDGGNRSSNTDGGYHSSNTSGNHWYYTGSYGNTRYDRYWRRYNNWRTNNESRYRGNSYGSSGSYYNFRSYWRSRRRYYTHATYEPYHWYSMARIWHKQAECDLKQSRETFVDSENPQYNWTCYIAHQAAEKALKAAWYSKDANKMDGFVKCHNLEILASGLDSQIQVVARSISSFTHDYSSMRYPRTYGRLQIPAEIYTRQTATNMIELTKQIIDLVQNSYIK